MTRCVGLLPVEFGKSITDPHTLPPLFRQPVPQPLTPFAPIVGTVLEPSGNSTFKCGSPIHSHMHTISYLPPPLSLLDDEPPTAFGKHDHGDATTCSCLSPHARQRLLGKGPVNLLSLNALCTAPPLFRLWFFRRRGLFLSPPTCPSHPGVVMAPTVVGGERVIYRYG